MSDREFSIVSTNIWHSSRFHALGTDAQLVLLYLITCSHQTAIGCCRLPDAYAASDMGWPVDRFVTARDELATAEMIVRDELTDEVSVPQWFNFNEPKNPNVVKSWSRQVDKIKSDVVKRSVAGEFDKAVDRWAGAPKAKRQPDLGN